MGANVDDHGGYGVVVALATPEVMRHCFEEALEPGFTVGSLEGDIVGMKRPDRKVGRTVPFTRLPPELFEGSWTPLLWGRWTAEDHITSGGGRTVVKLLDLLAREPSCHRRRIISLQDNRPIAGSFATGRPPAAGLDRLCRQRAALTAASEIQVLLPWVESSKMTADWLSRLKGAHYQVDNFTIVAQPRDEAARFLK